ncbi:MAG: NADP-dependent oxidoreductase [Planctomycetes bacterium]|nr:NADP-dependent oxidoreductase [Planctomycetota bacterium]
MLAVRAQKFGGPEVLKVERILRPMARPGEALVRVKAAGVNPVDWKVREGMLKGRGPVPPFVPGYDIAGTIESFGSEETGDFKVGDEVMAYLAISEGGGYAEFARVPLQSLAKKPSKANWAQSGGTPLASLTAWQALFDQADLKPGQSILIHGGAGGVGHFAVQLARWKGAKIFVTASEPNHDFLKKLGADVLIDYNTEKFEEVIREKTKGAGIDVVLDSVGGETQARSMTVLKKGGVLVSIVQPPDPKKCEELGIQGKVFLVSPNGAELTEIAHLIDEGKITTHVSEEFPLAQAAKAQAASESGKTRGKIVLNVK